VSDNDAQPAFDEGPGFRSWLRGTPTAGRPNLVGGVMLEGGAEDVDNAWRWFLARAGHGDIVVLRATPDEGYDEWLQELASLRSFQTLQLTEPGAAEDPFVIGSIEEADGLFIAGGDQSDYVRVWTGTPIQRAVNAAIAAGVPVGGISAGLAVLGEISFTAERDTVTSEEALADPFDDRVRLARGFPRSPGSRPRSRTRTSRSEHGSGGSSSSWRERSPLAWPRRCGASGSTRRPPRSSSPTAPRPSQARALPGSSG